MRVPGKRGAACVSSSPLLETPEQLSVPRSDLWLAYRALAALVRATDGRFDSERFLLAKEEAERMVRLLKGRADLNA